MQGTESENDAASARICSTGKNSLSKRRWKFNEPQEQHILRDMARARSVEGRVATRRASKKAGVRIRGALFFILDKGAYWAAVALRAR